ncbi:MAG: hypothetical protein PHN18_01790 [Sulfurospirillaceae bacterium]|jgi:hypothetical protein|nr:hypothetical protein [Sulfurospirillaceae bacterium]MDD2826523.1 hypothetical protein [Sulfurospirillaceae bacterium]
MGFWDKAKEIGGEALKSADETMKKQAEKFTNAQIKELLEKNPNNKYAKEEARKRGLL